MFILTQPTPKQDPNILPLEVARCDYKEHGDFSIPSAIYLRRARVLAHSPEKRTSLYIPDNLEDRKLLKIFKEFVNPQVDFQLFLTRLDRGMSAY